MSTEPLVTTAFAPDKAQGAALSPEDILTALERMGASGLVIDRGMARDRADALTELLSKRRAVRVAAVEAGAGAGKEALAELGSIDRSEAATAARVVRAAIRRAEALSARAVILAPGTVQAVSARWSVVSDRFMRRQFTVDDVLGSGEERDAKAERNLDALRRQVDRLLGEAEDCGVVLCLPNRRRYIDLVSARELDELRAEFAGAPLAPLFDVARAHLLDLVGHEPLAVTLAAFGNGPLAYTGDACGPIGALPRGHGIVDLAAVDAALSPSAERVFSPWAGLSVDELVAFTESART